MANKSKIQLEVEVIETTANKVVSSLKSAFNKLAKTPVSPHIGSIIGEELDRAMKAVEQFQAKFERAMSFKTSKANPFSQVFSNSDIQGFSKNIDAAISKLDMLKRSVGASSLKRGMQEFYKGETISGVLNTPGMIGSKQLLSDLKGNFDSYTGYIKSAYKSFQNELVTQAGETNRKLTSSGGMFGFNDEQSKKTLANMKTYYQELENITSKVMGKGFITNYQKATTGESGYAQIIKAPELSKFQQFMTLSAANVEQAKANVQEAKEWIKANKGLGESFDGQKAKVASFIGENERVIAGLGRTKTSFLHLKEGLAGYIRGTKDLLAIQARWYGARMVLFTALELPYNAIKSNLELGKAVKQAGAAADMSSDQMEELRKQSIAISNEVPIGANEIAKAAFTFAQAGMDFETVTKAMPLAAKLVVTTGEDMKVAVDALTVAFFAWKLRADELPAAADKIAAAMQASRMKVEDLGTVFNYLATTAKTLNVEIKGLTSLEDTLTLAATLSQAGVKPSTIGTGLGTAITRLVKAAKDENDTLAKILVGRGIALKDIDPTKNRLVDVFKRLANAPELTLADVFKGWELRAGRSVSAILNQTAKGIEEMQAKISEAGVLERMFKTSTSNVLDQLKILENKFNSIFQISTENEGGFVNLIKNFQSLIDLVVKFRVELAYLITVYLGTLLVSSAVNSVTTIIGVFGSLKTTIANIMVSLGGLRAALLALGGLSVAIGIVISLLYIGKYFADKRMAKEKDDLGAMFNQMTSSELEGLRKAASSSGTEWSRKLQGMNIGLDERGALTKMGQAGLERVPQETISKMVNEHIVNKSGYSLPKNYEKPATVAEEIDRSGGLFDTGKGKGGSKAYQNRLYNAEREGYRKRMEFLKTSESEERAIIEQSHKLGELSEEEYYTNNLEVSRKYEALQLKELTGLVEARKELESKYQADLAKAKTPEAKELITQKYENQIDELRKEEKKITTEATKERIKAETEYTIWRQKETMKRADFEIDIEKAKIETILEVDKIRRESDSAEREYQYSKGRLSAEEFYSEERIRLERETADEIEKINNDLQAVIEKYSQTWSIYGDKKQETIDAWTAVEKAAEDAENKTTISVENGVAKRRELRRKELEDIKMIYSESGWVGVVKYSMNEIYTEYSNFGSNLKTASDSIFSGMSGSFKTLFTDMIKGELKSAEDYIVDFLTMIGDALADFLAKQMTAGIISGIGSLFGMFSGTGTGAGTGGGTTNVVGVGTSMGLSFRAGGGDVGINKAYIIGEKGPELFVPNANGSIIPNGGFGFSQQQSAPVMIVNIENKTGSDAKATQSQPQFDGKKWVKTVMIELAEKDMSIRSKYGVK